MNKDNAPVPLADAQVPIQPATTFPPSAGVPSANLTIGMAAEIERPWFKLMSILGGLGLAVGSSVAGLAVWQTSDRSTFLAEQKATAEAQRDAAQKRVAELQADALRLKGDLEQMTLRGCRVLVSNTTETELDGPASIQSILPTEGGSPVVVFSQGPDNQTTNVPVNLGVLKFPFELPGGASIRSHGPTALFVQGTCRSK